MVCSILVQAKSIELEVSPSTGKVNTGSTLEFSVVVRNTQAVSDDVNVFLAGSLVNWAKASETSFTIGPNTEKKIIITAAPSASTPGGTYDLTISVSSTDNERWDSKTINPIEVYQKTAGLRGYHEQPSPPGPPSPTPPSPPQPKSVYGLNIYFEPKITTDRGFNLKDGDQCCVGDTITVGITGSGEFYGKGGPTDSPPIEFVEDLDEKIKEIELGLYKPKTHPLPVCTYLARCYECPQCWGISGCQCTYEGVIDDGQEWNCECIKVAAVLCEAPCKNSNFGGIEDISNNIFQVKDAGTLEIYTTCMARCIMYYESGSYHFIELGGPDTPWYYGDEGGGTNKAVISERLFVNAVTGTRGPDLKIKDYTYNQVDGKNLIRVEITNEGDMNALLDNTALNVPGYEILYQPQEIAPGETTEIIIECSEKDITGLKATLDYRSEKLGCSDTKSFSSVFAVGGCNADSDCDDADPCTTDSCTNPGTVDSRCTNKAGCAGTDDACGCKECESCNAMDSAGSCQWSCEDSGTRKCTRTVKDYYCAGTSCEFTVADSSYTKECGEGEICMDGTCVKGCDLEDGTWTKLSSLPGCGVKDTNGDGYYDISCCNGTLSKVSIKR
ncbi:MAG: hypothetical protein JW724_06625 [Candidatus Altiarchaeota archaeon]|nr:hypothetical protein [Candidatus Altiarchaeota archaeon]